MIFIIFTLLPATTKHQQNNDRLMLRNGIVAVDCVNRPCSRGSQEVSGWPGLAANQRIRALRRDRPKDGQEHHQTLAVSNSMDDAMLFAFDRSWQILNRSPSCQRNFATVILPPCAAKQSNRYSFAKGNIETIESYEWDAKLTHRMFPAIVRTVS